VQASPTFKREARHTLAAELSDWGRGQARHSWARPTKARDVYWLRRLLLKTVLDPNPRVKIRLFQLPMLDRGDSAITTRVVRKWGACVSTMGATPTAYFKAR